MTFIRLLISPLTLAYALAGAVFFAALAFVCIVPFFRPIFWVPYTLWARSVIWLTRPVNP